MFQTIESHRKAPSSFEDAFDNVSMEPISHGAEMMQPLELDKDIGLFISNALNTNSPDYGNLTVERNRVPDSARYRKRKYTSKEPSERIQTTSTRRGQRVWKIQERHAPSFHQKNSGLMQNMECGEKDLFKTSKQGQRPSQNVVRVDREQIKATKNTATNRDKRGREGEYHDSLMSKSHKKCRRTPPSAICDIQPTRKLQAKCHPEISPVKKRRHNSPAPDATCNVQPGRKPQDKCPPEKLNDKCPSEKLKKKCPSEKSKKKCPSEKLKKKCPPKKLQKKFPQKEDNECPPEKPHYECPPEKAHNECPPEKPHNDCPPEKPHNERPPEKPHYERPPEKLKDTYPPEKLEGKCPSEKLEDKCAPEKKQDESSREKPQDEYPSEKPQDTRSSEKPQDKCSSEKTLERCSAEEQRGPKIEPEIAAPAPKRFGQHLLDELYQSTLPLLRMAMKRSAASRNEVVRHRMLNFQACNI